MIYIIIDILIQIDIIKRMMKPKILITLPTGKTGFSTVKSLLKEGYFVRILVRNLNKKALELQSMGAKVIFGELNDPETWKASLSDIDHVYYCYPYEPGMPQSVKIFTEEAKKMNVKAIIFMGQRIAEFDDTGSQLTNDIRHSYRILEESKLPYILFAPGYFADNVFVLSEFIKYLGLFPNPFGEGSNPWISTENLSQCLVSLLKNPFPYLGQRLFPTGPKSISTKEMNEIFEKVLKRKVIKINIPKWMFLKAGFLSGKEFGFGKFAIVQGSFYNEQFKNNRFDFVPTSIVKELIGREADDFETIMQTNFEELSQRYHPLTGFIKTFFRFNLIPFIPIPNRLEIQKMNESLA